MRKVYEFLAWLDQFMALRTNKSDLDSREREEINTI